jgi:hypothetical protein
MQQHANVKMIDMDAVEAMEIDEEDIEENEDGPMQGEDLYPIEYPPVDPQIMRAVCWAVNAWCDLGGVVVQLFSFVVFSNHVKGRYERSLYPRAESHHCEVHGAILLLQSFRFVGYFVVVIRSH